jgi:asparagine synthase (glutamine-hydrolysing)
VGAERWAETRFDPVHYVDERAGSANNGDLFAWTSRAELGTYTANQLLRDTDVMSMAHSLEVRVPLLDERLVEGVLRLPASVKDGEPKALLLEALGGSLPESVRRRDRKQGFTFPFDPWLRGPLQQRVRDMVYDAGRLANLDARAVDTTWSDFSAGKTHWSRPWALLALLACASQGDIRSRSADGAMGVYA